MKKATEEARLVDDRCAHTKDARSKEGEWSKDRKKAQTYRRSDADKKHLVLVCRLTLALSR